jgi:hypothetical protein
VYKEAYGCTLSPIHQVYTRNKRNMDEQFKLKGPILEPSSPSKIIVNNSTVTPISDDNHRRSPRIKNLMDGHRIIATQNLSSPRDDDPMVIPQGKTRSQFPGPIKFPSLVDLEKSKKPYPPIPVQNIQEVAIDHCIIPSKEVKPELLQKAKHGPKTRSSGRSSMIISHG